MIGVVVALFDRYTLAENLAHDWGEGLLGVDSILHSFDLKVRWRSQEKRWGVSGVRPSRGE
jgi:hypothetical protein